MQLTINPGLIGVQFWIILSLMILSFVFVLILYFLQGKHMKNNEARGLSHLMTVMGYLTCGLTLAWILCSGSIKRDEQNITFDPSTLLVSRNNIYANFFALDDSPNPKTGVSSVIEEVKDSTYCFPFSQAQGGDPADGNTYHEKFKTLADNYMQSKPIIQRYNAPNATGFQSSISDSMELQQKETLGYYRYMFCMTSLVNSALAGDQSAFQGWMEKDFIDSVIGHVKEDKPLGTGCRGGNFINIPDTRYCLNSNWPATLDKCAPGDINPCFTAMMQSFSARCLFVNDGVSKKGVLAAFEFDMNKEVVEVAAPPPS